VADAVTKLGELAAQGVRTIVDPTVIGLGRYIGGDRNVRTS
jgi:phosphotriesterase-related protein